MATDIILLAAKDCGKFMPQRRPPRGACLSPYSTERQTNEIQSMLLLGFEALAMFLLLVLLPAGLLMGTPRYARSAGTFTIFYVAAAATGNVFTPDPLVFANFCFGLVFGMFVCLLVARLVPATTQASRRRAVQRTLGGFLPDIARSERAASHVARDILDNLGALLPQLSLARPEHDSLLRGMLACASSARELGRLRQAMEDPHLPWTAREALGARLQLFAALLFPAPSRAAAPGDARAAPATMWPALEASDVKPGSRTVRMVVEVAASLRFLDDRLLRDHAFLDLATLDERLL
ncbi:FUSC family protein [Ancylobacter sp.]|uniref:FUSC family protein n=1 Tax=Ancylobacter sp. TaxID=1872567 RepID=UPI003D10B92D